MTAPLGRNNGGYDGDTIDIDTVLQRALAAAKAHDWSVELFPNAGDLPLYGFARLAKEPRLTVYISTGIHGDEPAGPLALVELLEGQRLAKRRQPDRLSLPQPDRFPEQHPRKPNWRRPQPGLSPHRDPRGAGAYGLD